MKKVFLVLLMTTISVALFAQKGKVSYRVGLLTPVPVNVESNYRMNVGSSLVEMSVKASSKTSLLINTGFMRFQANNGGSDFTNVPVLIGARYAVNSNVYFGVAAGPAFFNKEADVDNRIMYTPHVGYKKGHIALDAHYINWYDYSNDHNNLALCVSYTL